MSIKKASESSPSPTAAPWLKRTPTTRTTFRHGNLRRAALDAVYDTIANEGAEAISLRAIADQLGINHRAIYRHFIDKEALLRAVAIESFQRLTEAMRTAIAALAEPDPSAVGEAYLDFAFAHPQLYQFMYNRVQFGQPLRPGYASPNDPELTPILAEYLEVVCTAYKISTEILTPELYDLIICDWALAHGLFSLYKSGTLVIGHGETPKSYILKLLLSKVDFAKFDAHISRREQ